MTPRSLDGVAVGQTFRSRPWRTDHERLKCFAADSTRRRFTLAHVIDAHGGVKCPRIVSTDLNDLRLLAEWHEVKLKYTAVSILCVPLGLIVVVTGTPGLACDGVGFDPFRSSCQKAYPETHPSNCR